MQGMHRNSVFRGAVLTVSMRWTDRLIGFVSILILARLLAPADFGLISMAMLVITLIDILLGLGVNVALIQNPNANKEHYDTAWTLRIIQSALISLIIFSYAGIAADYLNDDRIELILQILAFTPLLGSLENIGIIQFQKEMQFGRDFYYVFLKRLIGFTANVVAAWILQSYWALVIGTIVSTFGAVILSYIIHPMRPKLGFSKTREIFSVSQWMIVNSIGSYATNNLHRIIVGRRENADIMVAYIGSNEIAVMPSSDLLAPLNRVLFPAFVNVKDNLEELKRIFLLSQGIQMLVAVPAAVGLALVAKEAVYLLLGSKWEAAVAFIQILALVNVFSAYVSSGGYIFLTLGKMRMLTTNVWIQVSLFLLAISLLPGFGALQIAWVRLAVTAVGLIYFSYAIIRVLPGLRVRNLFSSVSRPLISTALMAAAVISLADAVTADHIVLLALKIGTGASVYVISIFTLWQLAGRPKGSETYILEKLTPMFASLNKKMS